MTHLEKQVFDAARRAVRAHRDQRTIALIDLGVALECYDSGIVVIEGVRHVRLTGADTVKAWDRYFTTRGGWETFSPACAHIGQPVDLKFISVARKEDDGWPVTSA